MLDLAVVPWSSLINRTDLPEIALHFPFDDNTGAQVTNLGSAGVSAYTVLGTTTSIWATANHVTPASDGYIDISDVHASCQLNTLTGVLGFVARVVITALPSSGAVWLIDKDYDHATLGGWGIAINTSGQLQIRYRAGGSGSSIQTVSTASSSLAAGNTYVVAGTWNTVDGMMRAWISGVESGTAVAMTNTTNNPYPAGNSGAPLRLFGNYGSAGALAGALNSASANVAVDRMTLFRVDGDITDDLATVMAEFAKYRELSPSLRMLAA